MATHNGSRYIREQLASILSQLGPTDEVIVSDDASDDDTCAIVDSLNDGRIRVLHHTPCGLPLNFENALKEARGDYVFLSDQDDVWMPGRVAHVVRRLESGLDLVVVDADFIDAAGLVIQRSFFSQNGIRRGLIGNLVKNSFLGCCMAFRRPVLDCALPFPKGIYMHDWWIALVTIAYRLRYEFDKIAYHQYRKHCHNVTDSGRKSNNPYWIRLKNRLSLALPLVVRLCVVRRRR